MTYHRTEHSTIKDFVNLEVQKIKEVTCHISDRMLSLDYTTLPTFSVEALREWDKCYLIPLKVALFLGREYQFTINGKKTILEENIQRVLK